MKYKQGWPSYCENKVVKNILPHTVHFNVTHVANIETSTKHTAKKHRTTLVGHRNTSMLSYRYIYIYFYTRQCYTDQNHIHSCSKQEHLTRHVSQKKTPVVVTCWQRMQTKELHGDKMLCPFAFVHETNVPLRTRISAEFVPILAEKNTHPTFVDNPLNTSYFMPCKL